jgi:hypothetical protein
MSWRMIWGWWCRSYIPKCSPRSAGSDTRGERSYFKCGSTSGNKGGGRGPDPEEVSSICSNAAQRRGSSSALSIALCLGVNGQAYRVDQVLYLNTTSNPTNVALLALAESPFDLAPHSSTTVSPCLSTRALIHLGTLSHRPQLSAIQVKDTSFLDLDSRSDKLYPPAPHI